MCALLMQTENIPCHFYQVKQIVNRDCSKKPRQKTVENKYAFQEDAYCPLVDRIPQYPRGVSGVSACQGGLPGGVYPSMQWADKMTDRCKNITLPQTSFGAVTTWKMVYDSVRTCDLAKLVSVYFHTVHVVCERLSVIQSVTQWGGCQNLTGWGGLFCRQHRIPPTPSEQELLMENLETVNDHHRITPHQR